MRFEVPTVCSKTGEEVLSVHRFHVLKCDFLCTHISDYLIRHYF